MKAFDFSKDAGGYPVDSLVAKRMGILYEELDQRMLEEYQLEAFRRTLRYAKERSDFYSELFRDIDP